MRPYILLIGAYGRDNFGDLLYSKILEKALSQYLTVKGGVVGRNVANIGGDCVVSAVDFMLDQHENPPSAIIHGGGETIPAFKKTAVSMNLPIKIFQKDRGLYQACENEISEKISPSNGSLAYLYNYSDFKLKKNISPTAFISIGGSTLYRYAKNRLLLTLIESKLKPAKFISVRDKNTKMYLKKYMGIDAKLYPDLVSIISRTHSEEIKSAASKPQISKIINEKYLLFQANKKTITNFGISETANVLSNIANVNHLALVLQPSGLAPGHDSLEQLELLGERIRKNDPKIKVIIQKDRNIFSQVAVIANSVCCIGTSLHNRVVATSFAKPCVSLANKKVNSYVKSWRFIDNQPYNVKLNNLLKHVENAINNPKKLHKISIYMADKASESLETMITALDLNTPKQKKASINEQLIPVSLFSALSLETNRLRALVGKEMIEKRFLERKLNSVTSSIFWKITFPLCRLSQECKKFIKQIKQKHV